MAASRALETLKLRLSFQTQVTCAREAAYSGDNMGDLAYFDIGSRLMKKQMQLDRAPLCRGYKGAKIAIDLLYSQVIGDPLLGTDSELI
jgi:hypothetical protein